MTPANNNPVQQPVIIAAGGSFGPWALPHIHTVGAYLIGADRGALNLIHNGFTPDLALGDFDSVTEKERQLIQHSSRRFLECDPVHKDLTDTEWAIEAALELQPASILLLGATGTRFDHTLANLHLLKKAADQGYPCRIIDAHNEISLLSGESSLTLTRGCYEQVSLLPLSGLAAGITLEGFRYPLTDASLQIGQTIGVSNVMVEATATVRLKEGHLLVIQSRD